MSPKLRPMSQPSQGCIHRCSKEGGGLRCPRGLELLPEHKDRQECWPELGPGTKRSSSRASKKKTLSSALLTMGWSRAQVLGSVRPDPSSFT